MTDQNDGLYSPPPNGFSGPDPSPYGNPTSPRRNRYTHGSMTSWNSRDFRPVSVLTAGMMSPRAPSSVGTRPLPAPSQPREASEALPPYHPQPPDVDATPRPYIMSQPSEIPDDRDWEPEEAMTIGQSDVYSYGDHVGSREEEMDHPSEMYGRQVISLDDPDAPPIALLSPQPSTQPLSLRKRFVGGFVASLRRFPKAVTKSSLYDRKATRKGAPGTAHSTGRSHFVPATAFGDPSIAVHSAHVSSVGAAPQDVHTEAPYASGLNGHASRPPSARRASSQVHSPSVSSGTPRFFPEGAILVDPELASDYVRMEAPRGPPDDSFSAHFTRVTNFLQALLNLPWVSERVAVDYRPMKSPRACVGKAKESGSWYNRKHEVDLLAAGPSPHHPATRLHHNSGPSSRGSMNSVTATRTHHRHHHPNGTPLSFMTSPLSMPSPGASSHGQGQHPMSYSYYFASGPPQPLYVYTPPSQLPSVAEGSPGPSPSMSQVAHVQPVYMIPGPPPRVFQSSVPGSPPSAHRSHGRPTSPTRTSGVPPSATQRSSHSRHSGSNAH